MAVDPTKNPLNPFVSETAGTNDVQVPQFPKLEQLITENGFKEGLRAFDEQMERFRQQLQRTINERLQGKSAEVPKGGVS